MSKDTTTVVKKLYGTKLFRVLPDGTREPLTTDRTDWAKVRALTDREVTAAALADPDNQPMDTAKASRRRRAPRVKWMRRALKLTQEEFSERFKVPLGTLRDWEQGKTKPDRAAQAYLTMIGYDPNLVTKALSARQSNRSLMDMLPSNFLTLHKGEEVIRGDSLKAICQSEELLLHLRALECSMNLIEYFARGYKNRDDDQLTIQLLGIRLFNSSASALKLLLSGYYQASALQQRDLLESAFLLDYLGTNNALISEWRTADKKKRWQKFRPEVVRDALDKRDKFTAKKRAEHYHLLSSIAAHPNPLGFRLVRPEPNDLAHIGPFFARSSLKAVLEELVKLVMLAAVQFSQHFDATSRIDYAVHITFLESVGLWSEKFLKQPFDRKEIDELKRLASSIPAS